MLTWILCIMMTSASGVTARITLQVASAQECHAAGLEYLHLIAEMDYDVSIHGVPEIGCVEAAVI